MCVCVCVCVCVIVCVCVVDGCVCVQFFKRGKIQEAIDMYTKALNGAKGDDDQTKQLKAGTTTHIRDTITHTHTHMHTHAHTCTHTHTHTHTHSDATSHYIATLHNDIRGDVRLARACADVDRVHHSSRCTLMIGSSFVLMVCVLCCVVWCVSDCYANRAACYVQLYEPQKVRDDCNAGTIHTAAYNTHTARSIRHATHHCCCSVYVCMRAQCVRACIRVITALIQVPNHFKGKHMHTTAPHHVNVHHDYLR